MPVRIPRNLNKQADEPSLVQLVVGGIDPAQRTFTLHKLGLHIRTRGNAIAVDLTQDGQRTVGDFARRNEGKR